MVTGIFGIVLLPALLFTNAEAMEAQISRSASDSGLWLCHPVPMCGDRFYNPLEQCCEDDNILPLNQTRLCGPNCIYWPCIELCCPESFSSQKKFIIKLKIQGKRSHCSSSPISGDCARKTFIQRRYPRKAIAVRGTRLHSQRLKRYRQHQHNQEFSI